jgi:hypothetical protein
MLIRYIYLGFNVLIYQVRYIGLFYINVFHYLKNIITTKASIKHF